MIMKKVYLLLLAFLLLSAGGNSGSIAFSSVPRPSVECSKCKAELELCTQPIYDAYAASVGRACDQFKAGKITKQAYSDSCAVANRIMDKADAACLEEFNKCCLAEIKAEMEKNKKEKQ